MKAIGEHPPWPFPNGSRAESGRLRRRRHLSHNPAAL